MSGISSPPLTRAQRAPGSVGVGLQVGGPSGFTAKIYRSATVAYDATVTTDADDYVTVFVHRVWERPIPTSPLHLYVGSGPILGLERLHRNPPHVQFGLSAETGLNFYAERFEVFLHVTPTLQFFPHTDASLNGIVGLRYYLRFQ